jgi:hypothetical protein
MKRDYLFRENSEFAFPAFIHRVDLPRLVFNGCRHPPAPIQSSYWRSIMKSLIKAVALAAVLAVPAVSFAQSQGANGPVTRAQVRNELVQLEAAGYRPSVNDIYYPDDLQKAQARVNAENGGAVQTTGYGPGTSGSSQSGARSDGAVSSYSPPIYNAH